MSKIKAMNPDLTFNDAQIISSYTCEFENDKNFNTYSILNRNLVSTDRQAGLKKISKYLYIFLNALRKLPRFYPKEKPNCLYRCILTKIDHVNNYIIGKEKTFWAFTSTSPDVKTAYRFLKKEKVNESLTLKSGTIFTLLGNVWGYDITFFNVCNENEVLLEPERKYEVSKVLPEINGIINIDCIIKDTPLVFKDGIHIYIIYEKNKYDIVVLKTDEIYDVLKLFLKKYNFEFNEEDEKLLLFYKGKRILTFNNDLIKDGYELYLMKIPTISKIKKNMENKKQFQIFYKLDHSLVLNVTSDMTILELKLLIEEKSHIPFEYQILTYSTDLRYNDKTLKDYNIQSGFSIHLRIRGF